MKKVVLASSSPRRYEMLKQIGLKFEVIPADIEEVIDTKLIPENMVQKLSYDKAFYVANKFNNLIVIGADTIVLKDEILGKPNNEEHAFKMLKSLQGAWHEVITGVTVIDSSDLRYVNAFEKTRVKMKPLSESDIRSYIKTGEPMDKAGSYGIQGKGAVLVEKIEGCYSNVVGLPLMKLSLVLEGFGITIF